MSSWIYHGQERLYLCGTYWPQSIMNIQVMPLRIKGEVVYRPSPHPGTQQWRCISGWTRNALRRFQTCVLALFSSLDDHQQVSYFHRASTSHSMRRKSNGEHHCDPAWVDSPSAEKVAGVSSYTAKLPEQFMWTSILNEKKKKKKKFEKGINLIFRLVQDDCWFFFSVVVVVCLSICFRLFTQSIHLFTLLFFHSLHLFICLSMSLLIFHFCFLSLQWSICLALKKINQK